MEAKQERMLSFGVEIEFYIFCCVQGEQLTSRPPGFESHPGGPLIVEKFYRASDLFQPLLSRIESVLRNSRKATVFPPEAFGYDYREWNVTDDASLHRLPNELAEVTNERSGWVGVELVSPALWATHEGFTQVRQVCEFLQRTFWIYSSEDCGLHIHVGQGRGWMPLVSLRQIAAFLYAADPVLAQSQPEHRRVKISHFEQKESQINERDNNVIAVSGSMKSGKGFFNAILGLLRPRCSQARIEDDFPDRPSTPSYTVDPTTLQNAIEWVRRSYGIEHDQEHFSPTPMMEAVAEILQSTHFDHIGDLMRAPNRSAYSFQQLIWQDKQTIEFRQAASTIDPAEVVSRARIAVRLCEFAANATEEQLHTMFYDLSLAEENPSWYDVYDLFTELDLLPEARVVRAALTGTLSPSVRDKYFASCG